MEIDHKLKKIYQTHAGYGELNEADQCFFDSIFSLIWFVERIDYTNEEIGNKLGYSSSTVQKKLKRCCDAGLLMRHLETLPQDEDGYWKSKREIFLDPSLKNMLLKNLNALPKSIVNAAAEILRKDQEDYVSASVKISETEPNISGQPEKKKIKKKKSILKRYIG